MPGRNGQRQWPLDDRQCCHDAEARVEREVLDRRGLYSNVIDGEQESVAAMLCEQRDVESQVGPFDRGLRPRDASARWLRSTLGRPAFVPCGGRCLRYGQTTTADGANTIPNEDAAH